MRLSRPSPAQPRPNAVRIIGGAWRGRRIHFPDAPDLRPTPDRVRETLFNWLGQDLSGLACLDLFAGSGALGFEAASRGAHSVVLVEPDARVHAALVANARLLAAANVRVEKADALEFLARIGARGGIERFDIVFLDPPFRKGLEEGLLRRVAKRLAEGGLVYVESNTRFEAAAGWEMHRQAKAGHVHYHLLKRQKETQ